MKRKRMIKLLMSVGVSRNNAADLADLTGGNVSHIARLGDFVVKMLDKLEEDFSQGKIDGRTAYGAALDLLWLTRTVDG